MHVLIFYETFYNKRFSQVLQIYKKIRKIDSTDFEIQVRTFDYFLKTNFRKPTINARHTNIQTVYRNRQHMRTQITHITHT